jgi:hypothetical protein
MYARFAFSKLSNKILANLAKYIEKKYNLFYSQKNNKAGLGCHDFHITLVGRLNSKDKNKIENSMRYVEKMIGGSFDVSVVGFKVTYSGIVMLIVKHKNNVLKNLIFNMGNMIPGSNAYVNNMHITIGMYTGKDIKLFEKRLNDSIIVDDKLIVDSIELDEDADINIPVINLVHNKEHVLVLKKR